MGRKGNYEIRKCEAEKHFLNFDQETVIRRLKLKADETYLYTVFVSDLYRIERVTGRMERSGDGGESWEEAGFNETLSVFDLLCHGEEAPRPCGVWAPVNSLRNRPRTIGVGAGSFDGKHAALFDKDTEGYKKACEKLGGRAVQYGDIGYEIPVFAGMTVILKFYLSDDEFPPQLVVLWDADTLKYIYYETTFYIVGYLTDKIAEYMEEIK